METLNRLGGIVRVVFEVRTRWTPNVGSQGPKALTPNMRKEKHEGMVGRAKESNRREGLSTKVS
jgi:hypothetical protein